MFRGFATRSPFGPAVLSVLAALLCFCSPNVKAQVMPVGFASTIAGGGTVCAGSYSTFAPLAANQKLVGDGCPSTQSTLNNPVGLAIDRFNNVAIMDQTNNLVRVIYNGGAAMAAAIVAANPQISNLVPQKGYIYTIVGGPQSTPTQGTFYCTENGTGAIGFDKQLDGCPGAYAYVQPRGVAFDQDGNLFVSSLGGQYVVRVLYVGGTKISSLIALENPTLTAAPQVGYVYEIAGSGTPANTVSGDGGLAYKATISQPRGLWIDGNENVYVADNANGLIRRVDGTSGIITTVAGSCATATSCPAVAAAGDGNPATASSVKLNYTYGEVFDNYGNMFIADSGQGTSAAGRIRVVYAGGTLPGITNPVVGNIYTYAGGSAAAGTQAQQATFQFVYGVGIDGSGAIYVNDYRSGTTGSNHVWRIDPSNGNIAVIAGNGSTTVPTAGSYCSNTSGFKNATSRGDGCPGPQTYLALPQQAPVFDTLGNMYVAERTTNVVRYFSYNNTFPTTAVGGSATQSLAFVVPFSTGASTNMVTLDGSTTTDFVDAGGEICIGAASTPQVSVCTVNATFTPATGNSREGSFKLTVGTVSASEPLIGVGSAAQITIDPGTSVALGSGIKPQGVSVDLNGNVYLSDGMGKQVLKTTLAGAAPTTVFTGLGSPQGTATDSLGNVYVADATNNTVLQRSTAGTVSTVLTGLSAPSGVAPDRYGAVYVADSGNNRILRYSGVTGQTTLVNTYPLTLSAPTSLFVDASGALYVLDSGNQRIVEFPVAALPQVITLPSGVAPTAFVYDHAGTLYVADRSSGSLMISSTAGSQRTLLANLTSPAGLAIDAAGDLFLADSGVTSVTALNRNVSKDAFATTNLGDQSLPTALTLSSIGDLAATLGNPLYSETGNAADFPARNSGSTCTAGQALNAGASCTESFVFAPQTTTGPRSAVATFTPTAGNSVTANLSGTAVNLIKTNTTITQTAPTTSTVSYGQPSTFLATVTAQSSGSVAPTGTVMFFVDGVQQTPVQTYSSAGNSLTLQLGVGMHIISASYSGDANYSGSNNSFSLTVNKSPTATTIAYTQSVTGVTLNSTVKATYMGAQGLTGTIIFYVDNVSQGMQPVGTGVESLAVNIADGTHQVYAVYLGDGNYATSQSSTISLTVARTPTTTTLTITPVTNSTTVSLQLNAKVAGAGGTPSGSVTFYNGTTKLNAVTLSAGTATLTIAVPSNYSFTASYSGDGLFQPSTTTITEGGDFAVLTPSANLVVAQGGQAVATVSVVSVANYTGTLTATCSNMPPNSICRFLPTPLTVSPGVNGNLAVQVFTGIDPTVGLIGSTPVRSAALRCMLLLAGCATLFGALRQRRSVYALLCVFLLAFSTVGLGGCGQNNAATFQNGSYVTPVGTYAATVTIKDSSQIVHTVTLNVQVNSQ